MIAIFSTTCRRLISVSSVTWSSKWFFIRTWVNILPNLRLWRVCYNSKMNTGSYIFSVNKNTETKSWIELFYAYIFCKL
jgi:hypothetical protein